MLKQIVAKLGRLLRKIPHFAFASFVIVLPFGYDSNDLDSNSISIGGHTGVGSVATVLRGCGGEVLEKEKNNFNDYSGSAEAGLALGNQTKLFMGIRAGKWEAKEAKFPVRAGEPVYYPVSFTYYNPYVAVESHKYGLGIGLISGPVPTSLYDEDHPKGKAEVSFHLRLGSLEKGYFGISFAENQPLISGGGLFDIGAGYRVGKRFDMFTGASAGFYDRLGFLQQIGFKANRNISFDLNFRLGQSEGISECAISAGTRLHFDFP